MTRRLKTLRRGQASISWHHLTLPTAALALVLLVCPSVEAGPPTETLRGVFAEANRVLIDPATEDRPRERLIAVRRLLRPVFEFRDAAELALGPEWQARTSTERDEFVRLFTDLLELSYVFRVASVTGVHAGVSVRYLGEQVGRDTATVRTGIASKDGGEVILDYDMVQRTERWMVRDVLIEGISLMGNYRAQFQRIIRNSSYPGLVARIKAKTSEWSRVWMAAVAPAANTAGPTAPVPTRIQDHSAPAQRAEGVHLDRYAATMLLGSDWILDTPGQAP